MEIQTTNLSKRLRGALTRIGTTYEALAEKTEQDLMDTPGFGKKTLLEAITLLAEAGYSLAEPPEPPTPADEFTADERLVLALRGEGESYVKIGLKLSVSSTRIVQIERSAMRKAGVICGRREQNND